MSKLPNTRIDFEGTAGEVLDKLKQSGKTVRIVAKESGVSYHWLSSLWQKRITNPGIKNMQKLAEYVNKCQP